MELHPVQASILHTLRHVQTARYTDLRLPTHLESDAFKFHLHRLIALKYVQKLPSGDYELTPTGKELANNLSKHQPQVQKQPKLSVAIVAGRNEAGTPQYLFQQRMRNPYYGFWGNITGPVQWGETFEATARREFEKQTGMTADYTVKGFYRKTDYDAETDQLLEDKLFVVIAAHNVKGAITNTWKNGCNAWMELSELEQQEKHFVSTIELIKIADEDTYYNSTQARYKPNEY